MRGTGTSARGLRGAGPILLDTACHIISHAAPIMPVNRNAARQPHFRAIGVTIIGVMMAPSDPPE